jgi:hypothetical protein
VPNTRKRRRKSGPTKKAARPAKSHASSKAKRTRRPRRLGAKALRALLDTGSRAAAQARRDLAHVAPADVMADAPMDAPLADAAAVATLTFVATVSNDGPWELRSLLVNSFQVLDKTIPATTRRVDVPIPAIFGQQLQLTWSILAGQLMPTVAAFVLEAGREPVSLGQKNGLKKGESWAPLDTVPFPPA